MLALIPLLLLGCSDKGGGDDTGTVPDGGTADGGTMDGGTSDGAATDGGTADGGTADGGTADGGTADGGTADGGTADGGSSDGGTTAPVAISDLEATISETMGSIVEVTWSQDQTAEIQARYSFDEDEWLETPTWTLEAGEQRIVLLGIPFGEEVTWELVADGETVTPTDVDITTDDADRELPMPVSVEGDPDAWDSEVQYVLTSIGTGSGVRAWTFIFDRQGRMVWAKENPSSRTSFSSQRSYDGQTVLIDYNSYWGAFDGSGRDSQVARFDIEGNLIETYDTPGLIHPFDELPDGTIVWSAFDSAGSGVKENLWTLAPDGTLGEFFACEDYLDDIGEPGGYCGSNALFYSDTTGTLLYSLYSVEGVIELNLDGEVQRTFGHMVNSWAFADSTTAFWWQHGAHFLETGNLMVSTKLTPSVNETLVREYELDHDNEELVEVWSFGEGEGGWAYILGDAERTAGGHTLHNYGYDARFREATPEGDVVWDVQWSDSAGTIGHVEPMATLYEMWSPE